MLLAKLNHYGICGVSNDLLKYYLPNHNQYVSPLHKNKPKFNRDELCKLISNYSLFHLMCAIAYTHASTPCTTSLMCVKNSMLWNEENEGRNKNVKFNS